MVRLCRAVAEQHHHDEQQDWDDRGVVRDVGGVTADGRLADSDQEADQGEGVGRKAGAAGPTGTAQHHDRPDDQDGANDRLSHPGRVGIERRGAPVDETAQMQRRGDGQGNAPPPA